MRSNEPRGPLERPEGPLRFRARPWRASRTTDSELHWEITTTAFDHAYKWTDGASHPRGRASTAQQRLVRMLTGIDADVERFLESDGPGEQAWILYERLYEI